MAIYNPEESKTRILAAARSEFAAFGFAGARMDRIAGGAGCNKNLIYHYFTNKNVLFATVIEANTAEIQEAVEFTPDDLPGYAARACIYAMENPEGMRLVMWLALEHEAVEPAARRDAFLDHAKDIGRAQSEGTVTREFPPAFLITAVVTLASAFSEAGPLRPTWQDPATELGPAALGDLVAQAVERVLAP